MTLSRRPRYALWRLLATLVPFALVAAVVTVYFFSEPPMPNNTRRLSMAGGLRLLLPQIVNHSDSDGPLYQGHYAPPDAPPPDELLVAPYNLHFGDALDAARRAFEAHDPLPAPDFLLLREVDEAET